MKKFLLVLIVVCTIATILLVAGCEKESEPRTLVINSNASDPSIKAGWAEAVEKFEAEHPEIDVQLTTFDHEAYKTNIRNFLASEAPDIAFWFAGNRMKYFVDQGLFEDVSDVWADNGLESSMASSFKSLTIDGKQYGLPVLYYQWGIYYRKDIFEQYNLSVPKTWDEFLAVNATLKENGIAPITIGTKFLWTAGGWFDYLNMRINGYDFHMDLTNGKASYEDPKLDAVFEVWRELVDNGYFLENHATYSWQEAQAPLIKGEAAMYLIGNFIIPDLKTAGVIDNIGFFQFPTIVSGVPLAEDAPTDTIHIPSGAKNKEDAKLFMAFVSRPDIVKGIAESFGSLSPNKDSAAPEDTFLKAGFEMLNSASALAQFYDRDSNPEMASKGMEGFQEFMVDPSKEQEIRARLEKTRKEVY